MYHVKGDMMTLQLWYHDFIIGGCSSAQNTSCKFMFKNSIRMEQISSFLEFYIPIDDHKPFWSGPTIFIKTFTKIYWILLWNSIALLRPISQHVDHFKCSNHYPWPAFHFWMHASTCVFHRYFIFYVSSWLQYNLYIYVNIHI